MNSRIFQDLDRKTFGAKTDKNGMKLLLNDSTCSVQTENSTVKLYSPHSDSRALAHEHFKISQEMSLKLRFNGIYVLLQFEHVSLLEL